MMPRASVEVALEVLAECELARDEDVLKAFSNPCQEGDPRPESLYILTEDGKFFRTRVEDLCFDLNLIQDGMRVRFKTPTERTGKYSWARSVKLAGA